MSRRKRKLAGVVTIRSGLGLEVSVMLVQERLRREHDEQIVAAILAQATEKDRVRVKRGPFQRLSGEVIRCCAVGAGLLYRGVRLMPGHDAIEAFAALYEVPYNCAEGISDGFEGSIGMTNGQDSWNDRIDVGEIDEDEPDYVRGWTIGAAIANALGVDR